MKKTLALVLVLVFALTALTALTGCADAETRFQDTVSAFKSEFAKQKQEGMDYVVETEGHTVIVKVNFDIEGIAVTDEMIPLLKEQLEPNLAAQESTFKGVVADIKKAGVDDAAMKIIVNFNGTEITSKLYD